MQTASLKIGSLKIGTRGSKLALAQAYETRSRLIEAHGFTEDAIEIVPMSTAGDRIQDRPLSQVGGKGLLPKILKQLSKMAASIWLCIPPGYADCSAGRSSSFYVS